MAKQTISNEEMSDIIKTVKFLEESGFVDAKEQEDRFLSMLLGTLSTSLLGILLTGEGVKESNIPGQGVMTASRGTIRAGQEF